MADNMITRHKLLKNDMFYKIFLVITFPKYIFNKKKKNIKQMGSILNLMIAWFVM